MKVKVVDAGVGVPSHVDIPDGSTAADAAAAANVESAGKRFSVNGSPVDANHALINGDSVLVSGIKAEAG